MLNVISFSHYENNGVDSPVEFEEYPRHTVLNCLPLSEIVTRDPRPRVMVSCVIGERQMSTAALICQRCTYVATSGGKKRRKRASISTRDTDSFCFNSRYFFFPLYVENFANEIKFNVFEYSRI